MSADRGPGLGAAFVVSCPRQMVLDRRSLALRRVARHEGGHRARPLVAYAACNRLSISSIDGEGSVW
jgi:hypothetical protein